MMIALWLLTVIGTFAAAAGQDRFSRPPHQAKPWVYWTCQDGHYSIEGTTADLEAMKSAGIGGVIRMDCTVPGISYGGTPFLSEKWRQQFVHAVHECERLGLEFATITGPGWTGTGGPWITADQSMQHLVPETVKTKGPSKFNQRLPLPQPCISRYHLSQTPKMRKEIREFYRDFAVFAFPRREPVIADIQEKALFIRNPYTSMPGVRPRLPSPAAYPAATAEQVIAPESIIDLTGRLRPDGRLVWDVPPGEWTIVRLCARSTGANTRPAPTAGLGLESDKFSKEALETHFKAYFDPLLKAIGPRPKHRTAGFAALDADSWEMSSQNWTPGFRDEFKERRGYDPRLYFVTYTGCVVGSRERTERFLWDVRKSCQELLLENHAEALIRLCRRRGLRLMIEPYDMNPAGDLDLGSYADYPAGEFWYDTYKSGWSCITAASIAHIMGKPIVLAESFTSIGNWARSPWILKNQTDWAFAVGINKFAIHGFAHQSDANAPGMTFGPYGVFWNRKQTFWPLVKAYHEYLARCSYLLQQGAAVSDILYLTPEGAPQVFQPPPSALRDAGGRLPDKKGYAFDGCSPRILMNRAIVKDGMITFPGGTEYRLLVLPQWQTMTPQLLARIRDLVRAGATVAGSPPVKSPSLSNYPACDKKVPALAEDLWGSLDAPNEVTRRRYGSGSIWWGGALSPSSIRESRPEALAQSKDARVLGPRGMATWHLAPMTREDELYPHYDLSAFVLKEMGVREDFVSNGPARYAHRRTVDHDIYFVSNISGGAVNIDCAFRVGSGRPELWDPVTGAIRPLGQYQQTNGLTIIPVKFFPYQSFFVVFPRTGSPRATAASGAVNFPESRCVATLEGPWQVRFDPKRGGPNEIRFDKLYDWTESENEGVKYYSGIATYRKVFDLPEVSGRLVYLGLGEVHEMARIRLNDEDLGVVWCAPWRIDISAALKAGKNELEIEVANLWPNRLIGDAGKPASQRLSWTAINHSYDAKSPLLPSGLIGPVSVMVED